MGDLGKTDSARKENSVTNRKNILKHFEMYQTYTNFEILLTHKHSGLTGQYGYNIL